MIRGLNLTQDYHNIDGKITQKTPNKIITYILTLTKFPKLRINIYSNLPLKINTQLISVSITLIYLIP
jgi:hypothetical protein